MKKSKDKNLLKNSGITLIALVITVIVLLILAGVTVATLTGDNGLLGKAGNAKIETEKAEIRETIELECISLEGDKNLKSKTDKEKLEILVERLKTRNGLEEQNTNYEISSKFASITTKQGFEYTVLFDNTVIEGKLAYLDIADGNIDLYSNGYTQYTGNLKGINKNNVTKEYTGKYIITGTTTENVVRVCDVGTYNIIVRDLNINVEGKSPITCNANRYPNDVEVNITLNGNNYLTTTSGPCLSFDIAYTTEEITNRSTITFNGEGSLTANVIGNQLGSVIGGSYGGAGTYNNCNANLIINSGTFNIGASYNGASIGSGLRGSGFLITINGGKIYAKGGEYGGAIGGRDGDGKVTINGGYIQTSGNSVIGYRWKEVEINGGTIDTGRVSCKTGGNIKISGGNILSKNNGISTYDGNTLVTYVPTIGTNNIYETKIKLNEVGENKKITKLVTSDNIVYGIKDMYTFEDGMLYLYLPEGNRTITVEADGKTYSGVVNTTVEGSITELTAI